MPVLIEPTELLAERLATLPETQAAGLWNELEDFNLRLNSLMSGHTPAAPVLTELERLALRLVCRHWHLEAALLLSAYRFQHLVHARTQLVALLRYELSYTQERIARLLHRDRTTVGHALRLHEGWLRRNQPYAERYERLRQEWCNATLLPDAPQKLALTLAR